MNVYPCRQAGGQARLDEVSGGRAARQGVLLLGAEGAGSEPEEASPGVNYQRCP